MMVGHMARYVLVCLLAIVATTPSGAAQTVADLFDDTRIHDISLTVDPGDWETLRREYLLNTYYAAAFTYNDQSLARVGIRSRGSGSRSPIKPNLLLSFDRYDKTQEFRGLAAIVLKANNQDPSLLREVLAMSMFRRMGVPAPREAPARLFINGEYFGAYTIVERIDSAFLRDRLGENSGYLYEWEARRSVEGYRFEDLGTDPASYSPVLWSPSNNESNPDPAPIVEMVQLVNYATDQEFRDGIGEFLDVDNFLRFIAVENFMADYDGFLGTVFGMNNFYAYRFAGTKRSIFIPWDKDSTYDWELKPIFEGVPDNVLARRILDVPEWRQLYLSYVIEASELAGTGDWLHMEALRLYELVREPAWADVNKQCAVEGYVVPCGPSDFEAGVSHLLTFTPTRTWFAASEARNALGPTQVADSIRAR
jgi:hypothetical protein